MKYEITSVRVGPTQVDGEKTVYLVYYNMTLGNTFTATQLYVPAIDELDAYYRACHSIEERADKLEEIIEKREQQDV
jgi:hypothetical protein